MHSSKLFSSVLTLVFFALSADAFAQLTKLNVGYVGVTSDNAAAFIARETGIYAKNGLDVQLIYLNSGTTAVTALIAGDTPISQTAGPGVINATINGSDAVMIAGGNVTLDYWMLSRPEIKTPEQLKGGGGCNQPLRLGVRLHRSVCFAAARIDSGEGCRDPAGRIADRKARGDGNQTRAGDGPGATGHVSSANARF